MACNQNTLVSVPFPWPDWLPTVISQSVTKLHSQIESEGDSARALEVLTRLTSDKRMKRVWTEIFKRKRADHRSTSEYLHPAIVTYASMAKSLRKRAADFRKSAHVKDQALAKVFELEANDLDSRPDRLDSPDPFTWLGQTSGSKWTEQELAAAKLFRAAYQCAIDPIEPELLSDLLVKAEYLDKAAERMREEANVLTSQYPALKRQARRLRTIADDLEFEAQSSRPLKGDLGVIIRPGADDHVRMYVAFVSSTTLELFDKPHYSALATIANVVFERDDITRDRVREILSTVGVEGP
jgi:hypothetical protein